MPGIATVGAGAARAVLAQDLGIRVVMVAVMAVGVWLSVRGSRMAVVVDPESVIVRGLLWSRHIRRDAVVEVTRLAGLRWRDGQGRRRWTPLVIFLESSGSIETSRRYNQARLRELSVALNVDVPHRRFAEDQK
jgi:hypothetical protein